VHKIIVSALASLLFLLLLLSVACGDDGGGAGPCTSTADCEDGFSCVDSACVADAADSGSDGARDSGRDTAVDAPPACAEPCDGVCIGGACCEVASACGDVCCGGTEVCSFLRCVTPGAECQNEDDCAAGDYCEPQLAGDGVMCDGTLIASGRCLPRPPACPDGTTPDPVAPMCVTACTFTPDADAFDVELSLSWGAFDGSAAAPNLTDVRNSPIVIQLDDDDCDGRITGRDIPEIVIITSPDDQNRPDGTNAVGDLVVLSAADGALTEKWRVAASTNPWTYPAAGNIDGAPGNEIVACSIDRRTIVAYHIVADALVERWTSPVLPALCVMPNIADVDQDGMPEVIVGGTVLAGETGAVRYMMDEPDRDVILSDVDGDAEHTLEIVSARRIHSLVGGRFVVLADRGAGTGHPIVADLEAGGLPEIITVEYDTHTLTVWRYDGAGGVETLRTGLDINGTLDPTLCGSTSAGRTHGGGPPTAADVNGDGTPDIAVAGGVGYAVLDGRRLVDSTVADADTFFWTQSTIDCSSARTGSSVFDFNGDGRAEVLYADEHYLRIYEGMTGTVLFEACNTNGTILEMPIVADVDGDGQADIIVASNARYRECRDVPGTRTSGIRVYSSTSGTWVRTRRVWNQHAYHVTNVEESGEIPTREAPNWSTPGLNNFRQNKQPGNELSAVDAVLTLRANCSSAELGVTVTVRNLGEAVMPIGAEVRLYRGPIVSAPDPADLLGTMNTTRALFPAQAEDLNFPTTDPGILGGSVRVHAVVELPATARECREDNNSAEGLDRGCLM